MNLCAYGPILLVAIGLSGCGQGGGDAAAKEYEIVARSADGPEEKCNAAKKVAEAYLNEQKEAQYQNWKSMAESQCASFERGEKALDEVRDLM